MTGYNYQLYDNQTGEVVFKISSFENGAGFNKLTRYNYFSMLLVRNGKGEVMRDDARYKFNADCLICISLYQPFKINPENEFEGLLIDFHPGFFCLFKHRNEVSCNGVLFNNLYDTPVVNLTAPEMETLKIISGEIERELALFDKPDHDAIISYLKIFLINASRTKQEQQNIQHRHREIDNPAAVMLKEAVEQHFRALHGPADYAKLLFASTHVLNNIAKQYFNKTLTNLIAERMITEAKRELYLTVKPVKQIAFELNYRDEFYFSRFFKKHTGVSPAVFRDKVGFGKLQEA